MRSVLITGASKGIGQACAFHLAGRGYLVFAGVRRDADGAALRAQVGEQLVPLLLDVTRPDQIARAADAMKDRLGNRGLDGLVNNAGIALAGPLEFLPLAELREQLEVNVIGQVAVIQAVLPLIRLSRGRIINIGSISGRSALPMTGAYAASKHAIEALTDALRVELMPWNIQVALVEPGVIATPIWHTSIAAAERIMKNLPAAAFEYYGAIMNALKQDVTKRSQQGRAPDRVALVVQHALEARKPRTRYVVGRDARMRLLLESMPDRWRDRVIARRLARMRDREA
ncbi:MAG: SDR family oxidoreductase [Longimicrobiales bacterium]